MLQEFYPTEIAYTIKLGHAVVRIFGKTKKGEQICLEDSSFEPYFTITGNPELSELEKLKVEDNKIIRVERVQKNLDEKPITAYRIYVNLPKAVPALLDAVKKIDGVIGVYEADILFSRRYLIDKNIIPLVLTKFEGSQIQSDLKVKLYKIEKIWQEQNETNQLDNPKMLALDIETYSADGSISAQNNPVVMIGLYGEKFQKVLTWKKFKTPHKYVEFLEDEAEMLTRFVELVEEYKPDLISGYFTDGFDFPFMLERAKQNKVKLNIGLDNSEVSMRGRGIREAKIAGIIHFDVFQYVKRVISKTLKTDSLSLNVISGALLGESKHDVDMQEMFKAWAIGSDELSNFAAYNLQDCKLTYDLAIKVMPSLFEFVRIIGLKPQDINRMSYSALVEWYLIKQANNLNEIILNKPTGREQQYRMKEHVKGAFVFEPKPGLYKDIAVFDYRSLYPSIIASHNISRGVIKKGKSETDPTIETERGIFHYDTKRKGLFSQVIQHLILYRAKIKKEIKKNPKDEFLLARSNALKILANSFYGYMGFAMARWYSIECAASTTAWARQYIHQSIDEATKKGFTVLYSDTDSVFLLLENKTEKDAMDLVNGINKKLPNLMELEFEGLYPSGIFVSTRGSQGGAKKKYALIDLQNKLTIKGFETVRRNWSLIAKEVQKKLLNMILKDNDVQAAKKYVKQVILDLRSNSIPLEKTVIKTKISRPLDDYAAIGPHVAIARKMQKRGQKVGKGTMIRYVVGRGNGKIRDKAKLVDEVKQKDYDGEYYVQHQILPGVEQIFAVLGIGIEELTSDSKQSTLFGF